jgi:hypothetical protein
MSAYYQIRREGDFRKVAFCLQLSATDEEFLGLLELFGLREKVERALA